MILRPWQQAALDKAINWFVNEKKDKKFLINAAPGAGKTIAAITIAQKLFDMNEIERVIVIAPRKTVIDQWKDDFKLITKKEMLVVSSGEIESYGMDICATWSAIEGLRDGFQKICHDFKTLVICDEHHHAAVGAVWGKGANNAFEKCRYSIVLTGTPVRTDGEKPVWFFYSKETGKLDHPQQGTYNLSYGDSVRLKYCRPIFFHRHEGNFTVTHKDINLNVSGSGGVQLKSGQDNEVTKVIQKSVDFYTLARQPVYLKDGKTPDIKSFQSTMLQAGIDKLSEIKERLPNAAGLVIAPTVVVAQYMHDLLEELTGEKPTLVHNEIQDSENQIKAFRKSKKDWIVSVQMISEGVDIKRLRTLVYLPSAQTELAFRQAMGRVVRSMDTDIDDSWAYVIMPIFKTFEEYARRVEDEMSVAHISEEELKKKTKKCPICEEECQKLATICDYCAYEFPLKKTRFKKCEKCETQNPIQSKSCQSCGEDFSLEYKLTLKEALRLGGISRGMDLDEEDVRLAEENRQELRKVFLQSGDEELLQIYPPETLARIYKNLDKVFGKK
jgi:superfamily II DNA or RNA helicase